MPARQSHHKQSSGDWSRRLQSIVPGRRSVDVDRHRQEEWVILPRDVPRTSGPPAAYYGSAERKRASSMQLSNSRQSIPTYSRHTTPAHSRESTPVHSRQPSYEAVHTKGRSSTDGRYSLMRKGSSYHQLQPSARSKEVRFGDAHYVSEQTMSMTAPIRPNRLLRTSSPLNVDFLHSLGLGDSLNLDITGFDTRRLEEPAFYDSAIRSVCIIFEDWNEGIMVQCRTSSTRRTSVNTVTVWDVLLAISRHLSEAITMSTWRGISADRYANAQNNRAARGGRTLRKIDCLRVAMEGDGLCCSSKSLDRRSGEVFICAAG